MKKLLLLPLLLLSFFVSAQHANEFSHSPQITISNCDIDSTVILIYWPGRTNEQGSSTFGISPDSLGATIIRLFGGGGGSDTPIVVGTGLSITRNIAGNTITNTAPDRTVVLTSGTGISATGTYPNFTITNTAPSTITPAALTKTDDTNVTLTLGGTPSTSLLQATSLTLGWTGTLADGRIASASTWNAKQPAGNYATHAYVHSQGYYKSVGALSPLFTTGSSTDSAIVFTLSTASAHSYFGNNTGSTGAPAYHVIDYSELSGTPTITTPTLQQVTDEGNFTTDKIITANSFQVDGDESSYMQILYNGFFSTNFTNTKELFLKTDSISQIDTLQLPDTSGVLVAMVNGVKADKHGNVNVSGGSGWGLTGNAGTSTPTNFIGTTDNNGLSFRTNSIEAIHIDSSQQIVIGNGNTQPLVTIKSAYDFGGASSLIIKNQGSIVPNSNAQITIQTDTNNVAFYATNYESNAISSNSDIGFTITNGSTPISFFKNDSISIGRSGTKLQMTLNGATAGNILTSDANGNATWQPATGGITPNMQQVTDAGNSTTNSISVVSVDTTSESDIAISTDTITTSFEVTGQKISMYNERDSKHNTNHGEVAYDNINDRLDIYTVADNNHPSFMMFQHPLASIGGNMGNVGVGMVTTPNAKFQIGDSLTNQTFKYVDGNQANGKVLTSDANGLAHWATGTTNSLIGTSGTPTIAAGAGAGTSPTVSVSGTNIGGIVNVTTGTLGVTTGIVATITYNSLTFPNDSYPILYPNNAATALLSGTTMVYVTGTTTTFVITSGASALTPTTAYSWNFVVIGN